jgi:hypothetical protein
MADKASTSDAKDRGGKSGDRSIILILAGIVVTGIIAGYSWLKRLPKD